jgi:pimeloyl-ACP methyl ester carboxylesterase
MHPVQLSDTTLWVHEAGAGPPLLLLHGFPFDHRMWSGQEPLARRMRLLVPDQRGFGRSGGALPASIEQLADDAAAVIRARSAGVPAVVCGLSMGGYVAQHLAARHPELVAALVLVDTKLEADTADARTARHDLANRVERVGQAVLAEAMLPRLLAPSPAARRMPRRPAIEETIRSTILATPVPTITAALAALAARPDMTTALGRLTVPTLLVVGAEDAITPPECLERAAAVIPGSRLCVLADCGHMAPLEDPAAFNAALTDFLAGIHPEHPV